LSVADDDVVSQRDALAPLKEEMNMALAVDERMGKVSLVGAGMKSHPGVAAKTFTTLGSAGVNIEMISTSPIKISCVIARKYAELAVQCLHDGFALSQPPSERPGH
jgi:aspartate kinase